MLTLTAALAAFGGTYRWATAPLVLLAACAALVAPRATLRVGRSTRAFDLALLAGAAGLCIQLAPWPAAMAAVLSPSAARIRQTLRLDAMVPSGAVPLSVNPPATVHALGLLLIALLTFWTARHVFATGGVRRVCRALGWLGAALVAVALLQRALSPDRIFGYWLPGDPGAHPFGPFVNRNHLAGWLVMACPVVAGYLVAHARIHLVETREWHERTEALARSGGLRTAASLAAMVLTLVLTLSRSGLAGLGAAAFVGWWLARPRLSPSARGLAAGAAFVGLGLIAVMVVVDLDGWAARFAAALVDRPIDRVVIWRETLPMVRDFWLTGVGAGAYGTAMLLYQQTLVTMPHLGGAYAFFNQAHSQYLQIAAEGGLLLSLPAAAGLVALAWIGRARLRADRGEIFWIRAGAAAGLAGMAVQGCWETSLRMPANAALAATLAALLLHQRVETPAHTAARQAPRDPWDDVAPHPARHRPSPSSRGPAGPDLSPPPPRTR